MASIENVESDSIGEYIYTSQSSTTFRIREVSLHSATAYPKAAWNSAEDSESFRAIANPAQVLALLQAHLHKLFTYITLGTYPQETPKISPTTRSFDHLTSTTFYVPNHKVQLPKCHAMSSPPLKQTRPLAFILNVQMTIKSSDVGAFLAAIKPAYDAVLREPECAFFNLGTRHPLNPLTGEPSVGEGESVISFSEGWNCTLDWFREVQLKKEYYGPYQAITQPMYTKPPAFEIVIPSEEFCHYKEGM